MKIFSDRTKNLRGGVATFLLIISLLFSAFFFLKQDETISYASKKLESEISLQADGEISNLEVEVDYTKTNKYGVQGVYTSMGVQDLIDGEYLRVTVNYTSGVDEVITSGYKLTMSSQLFSPGNVNEVTLTYNGVSTIFLVNATMVQIQTLDINTQVLDETDIYENFLVNNLNEYITVTGVNNDGSPFNESSPIQYDETGANGYMLQGPSSGALTAGTNVITVSYQNATGSFSVYAIEREIVSISAVFDQGDTIIYSTDYTITLANYLTVTALYNDGSREEVNRRNYTIIADLFTSADVLETPTVMRTCTVEITGNEDIFTTFQVEVTPDTPISVSASQGYYPYYYAQDVFNPSGSTITVIFEHAGAITVTSHYYVIYQEDDNRLHVSDKYVQIGYRENGVEATPSGNLPVYVEQLEVTRVSMPNHDFTYVESEDEEEQTYKITISYYNNQRMTLEMALDSAPGMIIDEQTGTLSAINAGVYKVNVILDEDYIWVGGSSDPITLEWEIKPAAFSSSVNISSWYYGERVSNPHVTYNPGGVDNSSINYYYYGTSYDGTYNYLKQDKNIIVPTVAGEYRVYAYIPAGGNYSETTTSDTLFYIRVANNQITAVNYTWQYDETNANKLNPEFTTKFELITNYTISYYQGDNELGSNSYSSDGTYQGTGEYFPQSVGTYTVRITVDGTPNYNEVTRDISLTITRKPIDIDPTLDISNLVFLGSADKGTSQSKILSNYDESKMTFTFGSDDGQIYSDIETNGAYFEVSGNTITFYATNVIRDGGYTITLKIGSNYAWQNGSSNDLVFSYKITQATNQIQITNEEEFLSGWTYSESGLDITPEFSALFYQIDEPTIKYHKANGEELGEMLESVPVNAGTYFVVVSVEETLNYSSASARCKFVISEKEITIPSLEHLSDIYDGNKKTNSISNYDSISMNIDVENTSVNYSINENMINLAETNAGTYKLVLKLNSSNYKWSDDSNVDKTFEWTIEKASLIKPELNANTDYTGVQQSIDLSENGITSQMEVTIATDMQDIGLSILNQSLSATDALTYTATISILNTDNFKWQGDTDDTLSQELTFTWTIDKIQLQVNWSNTSSVYSGSSIAPTYTITGWAGTDSYESSGNYTINISGAQTNVGDNYSATLTITRKDGGNVNYTLSNPQTYFDITKAPIYVTFTNTTLEYNGQEQGPEYEVTNFLVPNEVNIYSFVFTTLGKDVGQYSTELTLTSNNETMNYQLYLAGGEETAETDFIISTATLLVDWGELEFEYDGSKKSPTPEISGWFNTDSELYNINITISEGEAINAGNYTANLSLSLKGEEGKINYILQDTDTNFEILKAKIDVSQIVKEPNYIEGNTNLTDRRIPFSGESVELEITPSSDNLYNFAINKYLDFEGDPISLENIVSVSTYYIVLELTDPQNYEWYNYNLNDKILDENYRTIRLWFEITLAQFDMQLSIPELDDNNEIIYGNAYTFVIGNNPNQASYSEKFYRVDGVSETLLETKPVDAGEYILKVTINASGDYDSMTAEIRYTITKRVLSVTIIVLDGEYGEWQSAYIREEDIINLASQDYEQVSANDFTFNYTDRDETNYDSTVPPKDVGLYMVEALLDNNNYEIETTTKNFEITKATLNISINPVEIDYGDEDPTLFYSGSSHITYNKEELKHTDKIDDLGISFIYESTYTQGNNVGTYYIYLSYGHDEVQAVALDNYNLNVTRGTLTVNKLQISATVDIDNQSFVYDGDNIYNRGSRVGATATANGLYENDSIEFVYSYEGINNTQYIESSTAPINAGEYQVTVSIKPDTQAYINYALSTTIAKFTITRANLTININDAVITYGDADPTTNFDDASYISYDEEQLQGEDTIDSIDLNFTFSSNYNAGDNALGKYYIYLSTYGEQEVVQADIQNYALTINAGELTVNKKTISATVDVNDKTFEYDGNNIYLGESAGAIATPSWSFENEQIEFEYTYSGVLDTTYPNTNIAPIDVGSYRVVVTIIEGSTSENNYIFDSVSALFSISKKKVDVIWQTGTGQETFTYNGADQSLNGGIVAKYIPAIDDTENDGLLNFVISAGESAFINAGEYTFTASLISDIELKNYELVNNITKSFEIEQATISSINWNYTDENYFIYNGLDQTKDKIFATFVGAESDNRNHNLDLDRVLQEDIVVQFINAGSYQIYVKLSETDAQNYKFAEDVNTYHIYVIKNANITVTGQVVGYSDVYDAIDHDVAVSLPDITYITTAGTPVWKFRIKTDDNNNEYTTILKVKNVGEYTIEFIVELDNHNNASGEFAVLITKKYLVLTATTTIQFGNNITQNLQDYTISALEGYEFAGIEDASVLSGIPQFSTDNYIPGESGIGNYNLSVKGFTSNNYDISYEVGKLIVKPREIVINITHISRTYGEGLTEFSVANSNISSGALEGTMPADIYALAVYDGDVQVVLVKDLDVGSYDVRPIDVNENYEITQVLNGTDAYTITQKPISIRITNSTHQYDGQRHGVIATISTPNVELEIRKLYSSDTYGGEEGTEIEPWEVGTYKVIAQIVDADAGNYQINYETSAELTITARPISIVISDQSADYSGKEPTISSEMGTTSDHKDWYINSLLGLCQNVNGEIDDLNVVLSIPAGSANANTYTISGVYNNKNYDVIAWTTGEFTINQLDLTITIQNQTITYGHELNEFVLVYEGFIEGEDEFMEGMFVGGTPTATSDYQAGNPVDSYKSTFVSKNITSNNYRINFVEGSIQVNEREITINILKQNAFYSGNKPTVSSEMGLDWEVTSEEKIYNNDNLDITLTIESVENYNVGQYDINYSYNNSNYIVNWVEGSNIDAFLINKVELKVIAEDITIQYGNNPVNSYSITGFVNNETPSLIQGLDGISFNNVGYNTSLGVDTPVGEISLNGIENLKATNYSFSSVPGKWTIVQRNIDLEADSSSFYQGQTNVYGEFDVSTPINPAKVKVVDGGLVGTDDSGDSGDVDILFNYRYFGSSNDGSWNYPLEGEGSLTHPNRAGTYTVIVTITSDNYKINSESESISFVYTILKHRVSTPSWQTSSFDATGEEHTNTLYYDSRYSSVFTSSHPITNDNNGTVTMTASEGGEYSITLALIDFNNYVWSSSTGSVAGDNPQVMIKWTISRNNDNEFTSEITISVDDEIVSTVNKDGNIWFDHTWIYGDTFNNPTVTALYGEVGFDYYYAESGEAVGYIPTDAGNYYVIASVTGTADWNGINSEPIFFSIEPKKLVIPTIEDEIYQDGSVIKKIVNNYIESYMQTLGTNVGLVYEDNNLYLQATNVHTGGYYVNIALTNTRNYRWENNTYNAIRLEWNILPKMIEKPELTTQSYEYDGNVKQYIISNQDINKYYSIMSNGSATNVGNYNVVVALIDKNNYCWADSSMDNLTQIWSITAKQVSIPTITDATYNHGEIINVLIQNYDNDVLAIESTGSAYVTTGVMRNNVQYYLNAVDAGQYTIVFVLRDSANYDFVDPYSNSDRLEIIWNITPYSVVEPTLLQGQTYIYDGEQIVYEIQDSDDSEYYLVSGNIGIDADEYTIQVSLIDSKNYVWSNGGVDPLVQTWKIIAASDNKITISNIDLIEEGWVYGDEFIAPIVSDSYGGTISITYYEKGETDDTLLEGNPSDAGSYYAVVNSSSDNNNFNSDSITINFTIKKAIITITPIDITINYGDELPSVEYTVQGLIGDDSIEIIDNIILVCDYDLNKSENRKVGQYPITFTGLDTRNYEFDYEIATLTVMKKDITITLSNQTSIYNGQEPIIDQTAYILSQNLCFVSDNLNIVISKTRGVNAGQYQLIASANNNNYNIEIVGAKYTIERAKISANEIVFEDKIFVADGNIHSLELSGNIPDVMIVKYENNHASLPGIYQVTARLIYDDSNYQYEGESEFAATMTINASELIVEGEYRQDKLIISSTDGFNPNYKLTVNDITEYEFNENDLVGYTDPKFSIGYDISLSNNNIEVEFDEIVNISLLLPENLSGANLVLLQNRDGAKVELEYKLLGNYIVFETDNMGDILLVEINANKVNPEGETDLTWLIILLIIVLILIMIWFVFTIVKAKKLAKGNDNIDLDSDNEDDEQISQKKVSNTTKMNSIVFLPTVLTIIPKSQLNSIIILSIICVIMLVATIVLHIKNVKVKSIKNDFIYADETKIFRDEENKIEEMEDNTKSIFNFGNKRFRSFRTKLKQADQNTRDRYKEFINYSKTISNVKNSIGKRQVRLYKGRKTLAIVFFRGKTICIAFPLDPKEYENTKYKGIDASSVKRFENTPMLIKLTSNRRVETAKYLLLQSM